MLSAVSMAVSRHHVTMLERMVIPGRSAFSIYRFDDRDRAALGWLSFCGLYLLSGALAGGLYWRYFPTIKGVPPGPFPISFLLVYLALCLTPVGLNVREDRVWARLKREGGTANA